MKRRYIVGLLGLSVVAGLAFAPRASTIPFQYRVKIYAGQTPIHTEVLNGGTPAYTNPTRPNQTRPDPTRPEMTGEFL